jgi:AraC-like DNA-binding protein
VRTPPDLAVLDLQPPDLRGVEVLARMRGLAPRLPVIVVAARPDLRSAIRAADLGVAGFFTTPLDEARLRARIARLVEGAIERVQARPPRPDALVLVAAALRRMREDGGCRLSVGELAAAVGTTARRLRDAAREAHGISMKRCPTRARLERALARLSESDEPIKAIAVDLGFYDSTHLAKAVRGATGLTPSAYRASGPVFVRRLRRAVHA